jgi:hypothetical protein
MPGAWHAGARSVCALEAGKGEADASRQTFLDPGLERAI